MPVSKNTALNTIFTDITINGQILKFKEADWLIYSLPNPILDLNFTGVPVALNYLNNTTFVLPNSATVGTNNDIYSFNTGAISFDVQTGGTIVNEGGVPIILNQWGSVTAKVISNTLGNNAVWILTDNSIGGGNTNLSYTATPTNGTVNSDTGTDAVIPATDGTNAGLFLPTEKTKLSGIASGATANQTDSYLLDRVNHTGTQAISTITNLQTNLDSKQANIQFQDEGINIGTAGGITNINITGSGLTASVSSNTLTIDGSGVGGGGISYATARRIAYLYS